MHLHWYTITIRNRDLLDTYGEMQKNDLHGEKLHFADAACVYALNQATIQKKLHTFLQFCNKNNTTVNTTKKII
jgi:hypothetical protein